MKKYLPLIILVIGVLVFAGIFFLIKNKKVDNTGADDTSALIELPLNKRPIASLIPSADGHWLKMKVEKITVDGAKTMDYELFYTLPDGRTAGVPGTITLNGQDNITRDLLLGSESSGKFRYDEGVKEGTFSLRFRNDKGKLVTQFSTKFFYNKDVTDLTSPDGVLTLKVSPAKTKPLKGDPGTFYLTMDTFGLPKEANAEVKSGPYGLFVSKAIDLTSYSLKEGNANAFQNGEWTTSDVKAAATVFFISTP